ncbi:NAD-dependent epimerase/dehydratase family protein [Colwellia sp. BRX9-1]|nr:NAD-dependent epimerase/dehydratase family protein [Colwellia sp. BRX9-1]
MNILLTGASGFVGGHLINKLTLKHALNLTCVSRCKFNFNEDDIKLRLIEKISDLTIQDLNGFDTIIHLAGCAHDSFSKKSYKEINHQLTSELAGKAKESGVKRFIFLSTVLVNGDVGNIDSNSSAAPTSLAAKTKLAAENSLKGICDKSDMDFVIIRSPLVYGEGVKANFAFLMKLVKKGVPLPFRWINKNKRSLVSVYNLCDLIQICIEHPNAANQVFLASDDNDLSTAEIVALMAKVQGKPNFALPVPVWLFNLAAKLLNKQDVVDRLTGSLQLDIEYTKKTLNFQPAYSVEHGFKLSVKK